MDESELEALVQVLLSSPELRAHLAHIEELMRQLVEFERQKRRGGVLWLRPLEKTSLTQPDLVGGGSVSGHYYKAAAWLGATKKLLRISLLSPANLRENL